MKDYVVMYPLSINKDTVNLVSEPFLSIAEAEYFAEIFKYNYKIKTRVSNTYREAESVVFADNTPLRLIQSNYREASKGYEFANWKYITR